MQKNRTRLSAAGNGVIGQPAAHVRSYNIVAERVTWVSHQRSARGPEGSQCCLSPPSRLPDFKTSEMRASG
jgi:hypothetical protein